MPRRSVILLSLVFAAALDFGCMARNRQEAPPAEVKEKAEALGQAISSMALDIAGPAKPVYIPPGRANEMARRSVEWVGSAQPQRTTVQRPASDYLYSVSVTKQGGIWRAEVQASSEWDKLNKEEKVRLMKDLWSAWSQASGDEHAAVGVYLNGTSLAHADTTKPTYAPDGTVGPAFVTVELRLKPGMGIRR